MKIYESDYQIVIIGYDKNIINNHIKENVQKILCVYDSTKNFLVDLPDYDSDLLALYAIDGEIDQDFIINRHKKLESNIAYFPKISLGTNF